MESIKPLQNVMQTHFGPSVTSNIPQTDMGYNVYNNYNIQFKTDQNVPVDSRFRGQQHNFYTEGNAEFYQQEDDQFLQTASGPGDVDLYYQDVRYMESGAGTKYMPEGDNFVYQGQSNYGSGVGQGAVSSTYCQPSPPQSIRDNPSSQMAGQYQSEETGYYSEDRDCLQCIACLLDPHSNTPIMHLIECPYGLFWDNKRINMDFLTSGGSEWETQMVDPCGESQIYPQYPAFQSTKEMAQQKYYSGNTNHYPQEFSQQDSHSYRQDLLTQAQNGQRLYSYSSRNADDLNSEGSEVDKFENMSHNGD